MLLVPFVKLKPTLGIADQLNASLLADYAMNSTFMAGIVWTNAGTRPTEAEM